MPLIAIGNIGDRLQVPSADNYLFCASKLYTRIDSSLWLKTARDSRELLIAIMRIGLLYDIKLEDIVSYGWAKRIRISAKYKAFGNSNKFITHITF